MESLTPLLLIIIDGWGIRENKKDNAILSAQTPNFNHYWNAYPHTALEASGPAVGLPEGIMGNSEVGHMNLGAGRIVYTGLSQIYRSIDDGSFFANPALLTAMVAAKTNLGALHLMGLVSDGAVHSHEDHLFALLEMAKRQGVDKVFVHCFMDGRDTAPRDGIHAIRRLEAKLAEKGGRIASVSGRFYAMDRDRRWDRVHKAYDAITGIGAEGAHTAEEIILHSYAQDLGDEFIVPKIIFNEDGKPVGPVQDGDSIVFFNFRADRARELTQAFTDSVFKEFERTCVPKTSTFVCMAPYSETYPLPIAFPQNYPQRTFGEVISEKGLKQLRIAETEKYAHVTFFFSGGREAVFPGEERVLIPSPREVATYDLKPEMSAFKVADEIVARLTQKQFDVAVLNFANPDMVGHTANMDAVIRAVEVIDACLGKVIGSFLGRGGRVVVTADHGNAEQIADDGGTPHTAHTLNPVPFLLISEADRKVTLKPKGRLCDVAPTLLALLKIEQPPEMTGESLIQ